MSISPGVISRVSSLLVGKTPGQFHEWLREQLARRGYLERGGQSRFAREADLSLSIISRALNEGRVPELEALRAMGRVLGYTLGDMMVVAGVATADELPVRASVSGTASKANDTAILADALGGLRASAALEGKTIGELLVEQGLAGEEELVIPPALPPDPIIAEIEASDISDDTKANLIRLHLDNRARHFEEARLERDRKRKRPGA